MSPSASPPVISVASPNTRPTVTSVWVTSSPTTLATVEAPSRVVIAIVGTVSTSSYSATVMVAEAVVPEKSSGCSPSRLMTTGKVAEPSELDVATMPTEATVPAIGSSAPSGRTVALCPALRSARSAEPTVPSSFQASAEITTNCADEELDDDDDGSPPMPIPPEPEEPEEPDPETVSPTARSTLATIPSMVERSTALSRSSSALATAALADFTWAFAAVIAAEVPDSLTSSRLASAVSRLALARARASCRSSSSIRASFWPLVTVSPAATYTLVTVPETGKLRLTWVCGLRVPLRPTETTWVPFSTVKVRVRG